MDTAVTLVAFGLVTQLVVGIAHTLLGRQAEGVRLKRLLTFLDTFLELAPLEEDAGTDQHARKVDGEALEAGIHAAQGPVQVARSTLQIGKPSKGHRRALLLANRLF